MSATGVVEYVGNKIFTIKLNKYLDEINNNIRNLFSHTYFGKKGKKWLIYLYTQKEYENLKFLISKFNFSVIKLPSIEELKMDRNVELDTEKMFLRLKNLTPAQLARVLKYTDELKSIWDYIINGKNYYYNYRDSYIELPITYKTYRLVLEQKWLDDDIRNTIELVMEKLLDEYKKSAAVSSKKCKDESYPLKILPSGDKLFPFQCVGVKLIHKKMKEYNSVLLADQMGVGKTLQALIWTIKTKTFPVLIITPAILKENWKREIQKFFKIPSTDILILKGTNPALSGFYHGLQTFKNKKFVIINYDIIQYWKDLLKKHKFNLLIADEAHYLKNRNSKRTKSVLELSKLIDKKILITGTPIQNNPEELIPLLEITDTLKYYADTITEFRQRYLIMEFIRKGRGGYWKILGSRMLDDINMKLRTTIMIRRTKKQVLKQLPDKLVKTIWVELSDEDKKEYEQFKIQNYNSVDKIKNLLLEIRPSAYLPSYITDVQNAMDYIAQKYPEIFLILYNKLWMKIGEIKTKYAIDWIRNYFAEYPNSKLVVFAYHKEVQKRLYEEIVSDKQLGRLKPLKITGDTPPEERKQIIDKFQNNPEHKIIVLSLKAAKEGITLTAADTSLFVELWWNPQDLEQAEDRIHRISQKSDTVLIYYLIAKDTIDEKICRILNTKRQIFNEIAK